MASSNPFRLDRLDLNLLRVLLAVHDAGGVTAAAEQLHLSQPTLSNALARLRKATGDPLFVRDGITLRPTPLATRLAPVVRQALRQIGETLSEDPPFDPARASRRFRVAMTDAGQMVFLPRLAQALQRQAPGALLDAVPLDAGLSSGAPGAWSSPAPGAERLGAALAGGTLDCAVGPLPEGASQGLLVQRLFLERYVGILPPLSPTAPARAKAAGGKHQEAARSSPRGPLLSMAQLRQLPLVLVEQNSTHHRVIGEKLASLGLTERVVSRVPYFSSVAPLIAVHQALAIVPSEIAAILAAEGRGRVVRLPFDLGAYPVSLIRHPRFENDPALNWFSTLIVATLAR